MVLHRHWNSVWLLLIYLLLAAAVQSSFISQSNAAYDDKTRICVVIRTFWGHDGLLQDLLRSLQRQKYTRCSSALSKTL